MGPLPGAEGERGMVPVGLIGEALEVTRRGGELCKRVDVGLLL